MFEPWCPRGRCRGMSRPLLKLGAGSGDILSDVLRLPGVSEAETVISGAEGRDELRRCCTNRHWPARYQPTESLPANAI